jgi:hypothetical protein
VCTDALIANAHAVVSDAIDLGASMSVMPVHTPADWSYPLLLQKLLCVVYAGMCWNKAGAVQLLDLHGTLDQLGGRGSYNGSAQDDDVHSDYTFQTFQTQDMFEGREQPALAPLKEVVSLLLFDSGPEALNPTVSVALELLLGHYRPKSEDAGALENST